MSSRQTQTVNDNDTQAYAGSWCGTQHEQNARTHQSGQYDRNTAAFVNDRKREEENRQRLHDREGRRAHKNDLKDEKPFSEALVSLYPGFLSGRSHSPQWRMYSTQDLFALAGLAVSLVGVFLGNCLWSLLHLGFWISVLLSSMLGSVYICIISNFLITFILCLTDGYFKTEIMRLKCNSYICFHLDETAHDAV
ncbi:hypothetical protein CGCF415_v005770 [Colletotrichum fructicola]|nr:hypothetical protein CGCF415_v005770 [Colletotrichum fructicola]